MITTKVLILPVAAFVLAAAIATPAQAGRSASLTASLTTSPAPSVSPSGWPTASPTDTSAPTPTPSPTTTSTPPAPAAKPLYFSAALSGANELPATPGGPPSGDPSGSAKGLIEVDGAQVTFAFSWHGITAPTMGHIHAGSAGTDGTVEVPLFMSALPDSATAAAGEVTVSDPNLVQAITTDPTDFYLNLHTTAFPDGAVRGQLHAVKKGSDPVGLLGHLPLQALMWGGQEIAAPGGPAVGDPDGHGVALIRASGRKVDYAFEWEGISQPLMGHIHAGSGGVSGPVVVALFTTPVPDGVFAIAGHVSGVDKALVTAIRTDPDGYYTNLHTPEFPGGAVRGQLFPAGHLGLH